MIDSIRIRINGVNNDPVMINAVSNSGGMIMSSRGVAVKKFSPQVLTLLVNDRVNSKVVGKFYRQFGHGDIESVVSMNYVYFVDSDYIELEWSLPKWSYGHQIKELLVDSVDFDTGEVVRQGGRPILEGVLNHDFLHYVVEENLKDVLTMKGPEGESREVLLLRIDYCYNLELSDEHSVNAYIDVCKHSSKGLKTNTKVSNYGSSVMWRYSDYTLKVYSKYKELQKDAKGRSELLSMSPRLLEKTKRIARWEITCHSKYINRISKTRLITSVAIPYWKEFKQLKYRFEKYENTQMVAGMQNMKKFKFRGMDYTYKQVKEAVRIFSETTNKNGVIYFENDYYGNDCDNLEEYGIIKEQGIVFNSIVLNYMWQDFCTKVLQHTARRSNLKRGEELFMSGELTKRQYEVFKSIEAGSSLSQELKNLEKRQKARYVRLWKKLNLPMNSTMNDLNNTFVFSIS